MPEGPFLKHQRNARRARSLRMNSVDHIEQLLDHALEATFPASDPVAISAAAALAAPAQACSPEPG
jgi:hypothetical protein